MPLIYYFVNNRRYSQTFTNGHLPTTAIFWGRTFHTEPLYNGHGQISTMAIFWGGRHSIQNLSTMAMATSLQWPFFGGGHSIRNLSTMAIFWGAGTPYGTSLYNGHGHLSTMAIFWGRTLHMEPLFNGHFLLSPRWPLWEVQLCTKGVPSLSKMVHSYFKIGCRKKSTRQCRKVLWVVLSSLFFKEICKNGTRGHGHMFTIAKGKKQ